jgi:hypothetical protein
VQLFGKYRGIVTENVDPLATGRLRVNVPSVGVPGAWALPCLPPGVFALPPVGANVWVEFEGGNTDSPIWVGCFWAVGAGVQPPKITIGDTGIVVDNGKGAVLSLVGPQVDINHGALTVV